MRKGKIFLSSAAALMLCVITLLLTALPSSATVEDYSKPGAADKTIYDSADILSLALGLELSEAEEKYLELYGEYEISYGSHIPSSTVLVNYDEKTGKLVLLAEKYAYTAQNGAEVVFLPVTASLEGKNVSFIEFDEESFIADFGEITVSENEKASVVYTAQFSVSENVLNGLVNKAYNDALYWKSLLESKENEYEEKLSEYNESLTLHKEYLDALAEYETELALYKAYKVEKRLYDEKLAEFNEYLDELSDYEENLTEYEAYEQALSKYNEDYLLYKKYLEDKKEYDFNLVKYNEYVEKIALVRLQLSYIDGIKNTSTALKRSVYNAIIGDTVTEVINNKDAISNNTVGVKPETVDMAGIATENLRALFSSYFALEGESEKYTYYTVNYEKFKENFINLLSSLDKMYQNSKVRLALSEKGIKEKYEILLAQLYYVANALSDSPIKNYDGTAYFNSSYVVNRVTGATPYKILGNVPYMSDKNNAEPISGGYPAEVKEPIIDEVSEPVKPLQITKPIAPETVEDPGKAPEAVFEPTPPEYASDPGEAPQPYEAPKGIEELILAHENGTLVFGIRESVVGERKINASVTVEKQIIGAEIFKVEFMSSSGELLCTAFADKGTYAEYTGPVPQKAEDKSATYEFVGWADSEGNLCDITKIHSNLVLYPKFSANKKSYVVTWNVDGEVTSELVEYGNLPSYPGTPQKEDFESFYYTFIGWDTDILPVTEDVTYTAKFKAEYLFKSQNGSGCAVSVKDGDFTVDCKNVYDSSFDLSKIIPRAAESGAVYLNSARFQTYVSYADVILMNELGVSRMDIETKLVQSGNVYSVAVRLYDGEGREIASRSPRSASGQKELKVTLTLPLNFDSPQNLRFYYLENGEKTFVRANYSDGYLKASYVCGREYFAAEEYGVDLISCDPVLISLDKTEASNGEAVRVTVGDIPPGVIFEGLYYLDSSGNRYDIVNNEFLMLSGGVSVGADFYYQEYTVTFVADGKTIATYTAFYGDEMEPPPAPEKASDDKFSYTFAGWTPKLSKVTGDAVYEAKYMKVELPPKPEPDGLQITDGVMRIIILAALAVFYAVGVFIPVLTIVTVKLILRLRRRAKKKKMSNNLHG